jgi:hypothetical protein
MMRSTPVIPRICVKIGAFASWTFPAPKISGIET